jgi:hypothetical protein
MPLVHAHTSKTTWRLVQVSSDDSREVLHSEPQGPGDHSLPHLSANSGPKLARQNPVGVTPLVLFNQHKSLNASVSTTRTTGCKLMCT